MKKILLICIIALCIRLIFLTVWYKTGSGERLSSDTRSYSLIAESLNEGKGFLIDGEPTSRRPPLYPLLIAIMLKVAPFPLGIQLFQALIGSLNCLILFWLGCLMFGRSEGLLAAFIFSIEYSSIRQTVSILPEEIYVLFLLLFFYFLIKGTTQFKGLLLFMAGIYGGLALLTKDALILFFPLVAAWIYIYFRYQNKKYFSKVLIFILGLLLIIGPWIVRNSLLHGRLVFITVSSGHNLYFGNNENVNVNTTGGEWALDDDLKLPNDPNAPPAWTMEADRYFFKKGIDYIWSHPGVFFDRMGKKIIKMWQPFPANSPIIIQWVKALAYIPIVLFGLLGITMARRRFIELFPIAMLFIYIFLMHAVTIAGVRYRYPIMPFMMIFAAYGFLVLAPRFRKALM